MTALARTMPDRTQWPRLSINYSMPSMRNCCFFLTGSDPTRRLRDLLTGRPPTQGGILTPSSYTSVSDATTGGRVLKYDGIGADIQFADFARLHAPSNAYTQVIRLNIAAFASAFNPIFSKFLNAGTASYHIVTSDTTHLFAQTNGGSNTTTGNLLMDFNVWRTITARFDNVNLVLTLWDDRGDKVRELSQAIGTPGAITYDTGVLEMMNPGQCLFDFAAVFTRAMSDAECASVIRRRRELIVPSTRRALYQQIALAGPQPFRARSGYARW